jgi:hypothetical protein
MFGDALFWSSLPSPRIILTTFKGLSLYMPTFTSKYKAGSEKGYFLYPSFSVLILIDLVSEGLDKMHDSRYTKKVII